MRWRRVERARSTPHWKCDAAEPAIANGIDDRGIAQGTSVSVALQQGLFIIDAPRTVRHQNKFEIDFHLRHCEQLHKERQEQGEEDRLPYPPIKHALAAPR